MIPHDIEKRKITLHGLVIIIDKRKYTNPMLGKMLCQINVTWIGQNNNLDKPNALENAFQNNVTWIGHNNRQT
jgi:hypothetical protein